MAMNNNQNLNFNSNNNFNNSNNFNNNQLVTHDNLFNTDIKALPKLPIDNFYFQPVSQPNFLTGKENQFSEGQDFNKIQKEEKFLEIINSQKKQRFMKNFGNKIKEAQNYKDKYSDNNKDMFIDDYINKIKEIYQDKDSYDDYIEQNGSYNFSICPFCKKPVVHILEKVLCIEKCFMTNVAEGSFDKNYTLSNYMEQYKNYYFEHLNCKAELITLYIDNESKCAEFLCLGCQKDYLNF